MKVKEDNSLLLAGMLAQEHTCAAFPVPPFAWYCSWGRTRHPFLLPAGCPSSQEEPIKPKP